MINIILLVLFFIKLCRDRPPLTTTAQAEKAEAVVGLGGSVELRSLSESSSYEAWVSAHSVAGEGEPSAPQPATTSSRGTNMFILFE